MAKYSDSDFELDGKTVIKRLDKKKHHSRNFNEDDAGESRTTRVNFKNYLRNIKEQEEQEAQEEWAVIRIQMFEDDSVERHEVGVFLTEDEAEMEAETLQENDADESVIYKVELL